MASDATGSPYSSSIARVNEDIYRYIFSSLARIEPPCMGSLGWIRITHVSRLWRFIALDMPLLWAGTPFVRLREVAWDTLVHRSKDLPLSLRLDDAGRYLTQSHLQFASSLISRSKVLYCHLDRSWKPEWNWTQQLSGMTLEHLRALDIVSRLDDRLSHLHGRPMVAPKLLCCRTSLNITFIAPRLLSLTLTSTAVSGRVQRRSAVPLSHLLLQLNSLPRLKHLTLENKQLLIDDASHGCHITIPSLRSLYIEVAFYEETVSFLEHIQLSPLASFYVSFVPRHSPINYARLIRSLEGLLSEDSRNTLQVLRPQPYCSYGLAVRVGSPDECRRHNSCGAVLCMDTSINSHVVLAYEEFIDIITYVARLIAPDITRLIVDDMVPVDEELLRRDDPEYLQRRTHLISSAAILDLAVCFQQLCSITFLQISNRARGFLYTLDPAVLNKTMLPTLDTLVFDVSLQRPPRQDCDVSPECHHTEQSGSAVMELIAVLRARLLAGHRLRYLVLTGTRNCVARPSWISEVCVYVSDQDIHDLTSLVEVFADERK